ncbi:Rha family transcriptional regulator [Candidatus Enterococcus ferrettii]|uniref:ORF6C domain-containing protein n=1 Tax=Candidatus Enterococcus ferrettii TaxID=2815324 RepID=A0ABV0EWB9_9ENTE|nr:Rha family transcriptional regulator [Enterococcus sp. 665A]MBO1342117.1 Rha family transcriptional regulator [Enterococcus sp. 665A]
MTSLVILRDRQAVTTSLQVAEAFDKKHKDVLEAIDNKIQSAEISAHYQNMFVEGEYKDSRSRSQRMYYMNRDGFSFIAFGFTGSKADEFKLKYIRSFNKMEEHIKKQQLKLSDSPREKLRLMFEFQEEVADRVEAVESDVEYLKDNQLLTEPDYRTISTMVRNKIRIICTQQHLNSKAKTELFKDLNSSIKRITGAAARNRIKAKQFDEVVKFINNWMPSTATMTIIDQMDLLEDE